MGLWGLPPLPPPPLQPPCQELWLLLHTVLPLLPEVDVVMSETIRTAGVVRVTLLSRWLKTSKVSGDQSVQTANLSPAFYLLTSVSYLYLYNPPSVLFAAPLSVRSLHRQDPAGQKVKKKCPFHYIRRSTTVVKCQMHTVDNTIISHFSFPPPFSH